MGDGDRRTLSRREALRTLAGGALALGGLGLTSCAPFLSGGGGGPTLPPGVAIIKTPLLVLKGHTAAVNTVAWSPDGTKVATTSDDFTAQIWDAATGASLLTYRNHTDKVWDIAWSPDGKRILTASRDMTAQIWDPTNGQLQTTFSGHEKGVLSAAWSPDGTKIATGSVDWTAQIWDVASAKSLVTYTKHISWVYTVAWSPDGKRIASASNDYTAHVWDAASWRAIRRVPRALTRGQRGALGARWAVGDLGERGWHGPALGCDDGTAYLDLQRA